VLEPIGFLRVIRTAIHMQGKGWVVEQHGWEAPRNTVCSSRSLRSELTVVAVDVRRHAA
jgi:hypothetical protein